ALIENCSQVRPDGYISNKSVALEALEKFSDQLDDKVHHSLVITLIKNCSEVKPNDCMRDAPAALKLLNQNKVWLSKEESNEFYRRTIEKLFDSVIDHYFFTIREIVQLLEVHVEVISAEEIRDKYIQTNSIRTVQALREYVQGVGQYRRINLPPLADMMVDGQPLGGIAFEVHNFTDGIESGALKAIDEFLTALEVPKPTFTINDLVGEKFNLIENEHLHAKAINALNKLLGSENYKVKLELALPIIAAFLNLDHTTWEKDYQTQDSRWSTWLTQSFAEAGTAYTSGIDSTSCVKGAYERLFSGFRGMHPLIDCLFVTQTVTMEFNNGIKHWLKGIGRANDIVVRLQAQGLTGTEDEESFKSELKQAYFRAIKKELKRLIGEGLEACFNKITDFNKLSSYLAEEIKGRQSTIIKHALNKFNVILDYLDVIEMNDEQTLDEYIRQQLKASYQSFPMSLALRGGESAIFYAFNTTCRQII
ncbi:MAG: hypothetical protein ACK4M7_08035, partial [Burkholderiales bacterium]